MHSMFTTVPIQSGKSENGHVYVPVQKMNMFMIPFGKSWKWLFSDTTDWSRGIQ